MVAEKVFMRPVAILKRACHIFVAAVIAGGVWSVPMASAQQGSAGSLDSFLEVTGQPGPHRVLGHYFTSPSVPPEQRATPTRAIVGPSTPIRLGNNICTVAVTGTDARGAKIAITAGHCGGIGQDVSSYDAPAAGSIGTISRVVAGDIAVITLHPHVNITRSYNGVTIDQLGGPQPMPWDTLCKTGITTGTSCGPVLTSGHTQIMTHFCGSFGDSGAPIYAGNRLVGVLNGGVAGVPSCRTPIQGPLHAPGIGTPWGTIAAALNDGGAGSGLRLA